MKMKAATCINTALIGVLFAMSLSANGQTSSFTYQGSLMDGGVPANGLYDFQFTLFAAASGGSPEAGPQAIDAVDVSDGLFTVQLDFGSSVFDGSDRWLQIGVVTNNGAGYVLLSPRQQIRSTPYAIRAAEANTLMGSVPGDFAADVHTHSGGEVTSGTVGAAYIDSTIARDSELVWGNLSGIPADIADGDQVGLTSESDPQVGSIGTGYVPKWNGSALVTGSIYDSGNIGIGTAVPSDKLEVNGFMSMNVATDSSAALRYKKGGVQNWVIMTAPWLNNDSLWIRNETGPVDVMAFDKATSRVGIRTTTPQATLDVNGDLRVSGSITYGSTKTGYASFAAAAFHPASDSYVYNNTGQYITPTGGSANSHFYAGVSLPHGATITSVQWDGYATGEGSYSEVKLKRMMINGSSQSDLATCYFLGSLGAGEMTDTTISNPTVDASQYVYYLHLYMNTAGGPCGGGGVIITYTYTTP